MTTVALEPRPLPVSFRLSSPCGRVVPGGRLGTVELATNPELAVSTIQVPPLTMARAGPLPVAVAALGAEQLVVVPPPEPVQDQVQGEPGVAELGALPVVHRPVMGTKAVGATVAQAPLTIATGVTPDEAVE